MNSGRKQPQGTDLNCAWRWQFGDDCSDGFLHLLPKVESQRSTSDSQIRRLKLGDFRKYDVLSQITSSWLKHLNHSFQILTARWLPTKVAAGLSISSSLKSSGRSR